MAALTNKDNKDVLITLTHISNEDQFEHEKPYEIYAALDPSIPKTNLEFGPVGGILARDARSRGRDSFTLAENGFQFLDYPKQDALTLGKVRGPDGDAEVEQYLDSLHPVIKDSLGASLVIFYDWRIRTTASENMFPRPPDRNYPLPPAAVVHADESAACGRQIVREHVTTKEFDLIQGGSGVARIVNIWRPLKPVTAKPLAVCDWRSVRSTDWEVCDQIHTDRVDEAMYLKPRQHHEWWWLPDQQVDELTLFVVWNSIKASEGVQVSTPHGAFDLPGGSHPPERESIEIRSIIWTPE